MYFVLPKSQVIGPVELGDTIQVRFTAEIRASIKQLRERLPPSDMPDWMSLNGRKMVVLSVSDDYVGLRERMLKRENNA